MRNTLSLLVLLMFMVSISNRATSQTEQAQSPIDKILYHLKNPSKDYILTIAHRGDWRYAPENSIEAIRHCIELGIDIVEIDVRKTKDGHLVIMHDPTVDRTTNGTGNVSDLTLEEIKKLRLRSNCGITGSRQEVPTLEEVMLLAKDKVLINLDKTEGKTLREAYNILKKTGTVKQGIFKGNDSIKFMRNKYGTLLDSIIYMPKVWYNTPNISKYVEDYNRELNPLAFEMIFDQTESPVFKTIKAMNEKRISVLNVALWDELVAGHTDEMALLQGPDLSWGWLIENGANIIMTDWPAELINYLRLRKLHE